eukprot:670436-Pelagomonas_calceolata.AAC.3
MGDFPHTNMCPVQTGSCQQDAGRMCWRVCAPWRQRWGVAWEMRPTRCCCLCAQARPSPCRA